MIFKLEIKSNCIANTDS